MTSCIVLDTPPQLTEDQLAADERMRALAHVYQTALSIIANERVSVKVQPVLGSNGPAAWTDGTTITINSAKLSAIDFDEIVRVHGLVFHELCHVRYSPRQGTTLVKELVNRGLVRSFNALEDQRIETMLANRYPSTKPWLTAAILRWVINDPQALPFGMLLVHGRKYLDPEVRKAFDQNFGIGLPIEPGRLSELKSSAKSIIDEFRMLIFPTDYDRALELTVEFDKIMQEFYMTGGSYSDPHGHDTHQGNEPQDKGRPKGVKEQREDRDSGGAEETDDGPREGNQSGKDKDSGSSNSSTGTDPTPGSGEGDDEDDQPQDVLSVMKDALDEIMSSSDVREEVRNTQRILRGGSGADVLRKSKPTMFAPSAEFVGLSREVAQVLKKLSTQGDPGWIRQVETGRINAVRWFTEGDPETAFDRWDEGVHDATDLEVVVMLDTSGSMGYVATASHQAMWAIKWALDSIDASTTVINYSDSSKTLYSSDERATSMFRYDFDGRGTDPVGGLNQAARIFGHSRRGNKVLIMLTDGQWCSSEDDYGMSSDDYIQKMRQSGVLTSLAFITSGDVSLPDSMDYYIRLLKKPFIHHNVDIASIASGRNLVPFIRRVVEAAIQRKLRSAV